MPTSKRFRATRNRSRPGQQEIAAVSKRFSELSDYDTKATAVVYFASGSTAIQPKDKASLQELARTVVNLTGYIIPVKVFPIPRATHL